MKMISPDGSSSIDAHPTRVEYLLKKGWKGEAIQETKSSPKKQAKAEVKENGST